MSDCPCGSGSTFDDCCGAIIAGAPALSAEALMRSRFTAFVRGDMSHVENTHAKDVREDFNRSAAESTANSVEWVSLEIMNSTGGEGDDAGEVEFVARYKQDGQLLVHHERSQFCREDGKWMYVDGQINPKGEPRRVVKVGRNDPCPCGSGKKYKKCCGANA
jgi:SEC-C motif domain protein